MVLEKNSKLILLKTSKRHFPHLALTLGDLFLQASYRHGRACIRSLELLHTLAVPLLVTAQLCSHLLDDVLCMLELILQLGDVLSGSAVGILLTLESTVCLLDLDENIRFVTLWFYEEKKRKLTGTCMQVYSYNIFQFQLQ